jgi:alginate O-acetyltransferase complex protein AlgI
MFGANGTALWDTSAAYYTAEYGILVLLAVIGSTPLIKIISEKIVQASEDNTVVRVFGRNIGLTSCYLVVFGLSIVCVVSSTFNPFIYFRF